MSRLIPDNFDSDENVRHNVVKYLSSFDDSIVDFNIEKYLMIEMQLKIDLK